MNSLADAVASLGLDDKGSLPYGRSHWDRKPAEVHAMILRAAGPLTLFVNGLLGDKDSLNEATVEALWTDAISIDWQGDLALLPDVYLKVGEVISRKRPALDMLSLSVSRSMYGRLCTRFPKQATADRNVNAWNNQYLSDFQHTFGRTESTRLCHIPMRYGWFDLVDFSYPIALGWIAIDYGHTGLLKHLAEHHGVDLGKFQRLNGILAMDQAAQKGHVEVLQMLHDAGNTSCSDYAMTSAARGGHLDVVKWLHANRMEGCNTDAMDLAAQFGHLQVVIWLHENRTEGCTTQAMDSAACNGYLDVVQWLHANRTEGCTARAMDWAAENGHLDVIKWLNENRTEGCTTEAMDRAAQHGHLDVVIWLHENRTEGCTTQAMDSAADGGHLEVVQWLHENRKEGCTPKAMDRAAMNGHLDVVQWLHVNRTEGCTMDAMDRAAKEGHLDVVIWLQENRTEGCSTGAMDCAAAFGRLEVMRWLHANRTEGCTTDAMDMAAWGGQLEVVQWLHENRTEGCTTDAIKDAARNSHVEVVRFLVACGYEFTYDALHQARNDVIIDALVNSMNLARRMEMLHMARAQGGYRKLVEHLERAVANKQS